MSVCALVAECERLQTELDDAKLDCTFSDEASRAMNDAWKAQAQADNAEYAKARAENERLTQSLTAAHRALRLADDLHRKSAFAATSGEHRGKHYCNECTRISPDRSYVLWPCPTSRALVGAVEDSPAPTAEDRLSVVFGRMLDARLGIDRTDEERERDAVSGVSHNEPPEDAQ